MKITAVSNHKPGILNNYIKICVVPRMHDFRNCDKELIICFVFALLDKTIILNTNNKSMKLIWKLFT